MGSGELAHGMAGSPLSLHSALPKTWPVLMARSNVGRRFSTCVRHSISLTQHVCGGFCLFIFSLESSSFLS